MVSGWAVVRSVTIALAVVEVVTTEAVVVVAMMNRLPIKIVPITPAMSMRMMNGTARIAFLTFAIGARKAFDLGWFTG